MARDAALKQAIAEREAILARWAELGQVFKPWMTPEASKEWVRLRAEALRS